MPDEKDKDDELVVVTDDPKNLDVQPGDSVEEQDVDVELDKDKDKSKSKEPDKSKEDDEEESDEDSEEESRLGASEETEAEEEQKRKKQSEGKSRRQRRREAEQRLRTELKFLETRNDRLERSLQQMARRLDSTEKTSLDSRINQTKALIRKSESVMAEAVDNNKGSELAEATRIRDGLRDQLKEFETAKARGEEEVDTPEPPPPKVLENVRNWHSRNNWFDFQRRDLDSRIAGAIDDSLVAEGFDPTSNEYWKELDKRIAKALPHRSKKKASNGHDTDEDDDDQEEEEEDTSTRRKVAKKGGDSKQKERYAPGGGPRFRTSGPGRELKSSEVYLSRERIEALKEAGVWEDPVLRAKYLKRYQEYDREHGSN